MACDPFSEALRAPDMLERLAQNPETRKHMADPGFQSKIEELQGYACDPALEGCTDVVKLGEVGQKIARASQNDPRIMQALMALMGQGLTVEEKDMKKAEDFGDMQRREPVQLEQLELVRNLSDADDAKTKGNEYFKSGDFSAALAHYEKGIEILKARDEVPVTALATLYSNAALMLLKLKWPDRAKKNASNAIALVRSVEDSGFDQSKLFYRRALACEQLRELSQAVDDMARAFQQAKKTGLSLAEQHRLKGELERLKKLKLSDDEDKERKKREKENERTAEVQRVQGTEMAAKKKESPGGVAIPGAEVGYVAEQDFSHLARNKLCEVVKGVSHTTQNGARLEITSLDEGKSKISASITTKKGKRALYYDMDVHLNWKATAAPKLAPADGSSEMTGIIRVYNIAHDTKFELGGDENTSYMYQLGYDPKLTGAWVEDIKGESAELFDPVAVKVDSVIREIRKK